MPRNSGDSIQKHGFFYAFRAVAVENISGFNIIANEDVGILSPSMENAPNHYNVLVFDTATSIKTTWKTNSNQCRCHNTNGTIIAQL